VTISVAFCLTAGESFSVKRDALRFLGRDVEFVRMWERENWQ
jgi:hypothetical protein